MFAKNGEEDAGWLYRPGLIRHHGGQWKTETFADGDNHFRSRRYAHFPVGKVYRLRKRQRRQSHGIWRYGRRQAQAFRQLTFDSPFR